MRTSITLVSFITLVLLLIASIKKARPASADSPEPAIGQSARVTGTLGSDEDRYSQSKRMRDLSKKDRFDFSNHLKSAGEFFEKRDIPAALAELDRASQIVDMHPEVLNLRGSCHVETRSFEQALRDFTDAAKREPHNPSIQFNIGEVRFVTKQWSEALEAFKSLREQLPPDVSDLRALIDFKIMLCHAALGNSDEFERLAEKDQAAIDSPISYFSNAALDYSRNNHQGAEDLLAKAALKFPDPNRLAPWRDTLVEYGWLQIEPN
jgi:tetratricopeptide (TPR) repeat protein